MLGVDVVFGFDWCDLKNLLVEFNFVRVGLSRKLFFYETLVGNFDRVRIICCQTISRTVSWLRPKKEKKKKTVLA